MIVLYITAKKSTLENVKPIFGRKNMLNVNDINLDFNIL